MKITKQQLKQIIREELKEAKVPAWERPGNVTPPDDVEIVIPGYGSMMVGQIKRKLAQMLQEAAEDAAKDPPHYSHLDGGVIQALHKALREHEKGNEEELSEISEKKKYKKSFYTAKDNRAEYLIKKGVPKEQAYGVADKQMAKSGKKKRKKRGKK